MLPSPKSSEAGLRLYQKESFLPDRGVTRELHLRNN